MESRKNKSSLSFLQKNKHIAKNTIMLYFRMILTMVVTLYTSRVILNILGVEDFGIFNIVGGVVTMFAFFNGAMTSATQRFLSYAIGKDDFVQLKRIFNATQIVHIGIGILILILSETVGLWFVKNYLAIPVERKEAALLVYHFSIVSFIVSVIQVPYNAIIIAHERMSVYAYLSILEVFLKLLIVFVLSWIIYDKLKLYGILSFSVVFFVAAIYRYYASKNFAETKFEVIKDIELYRTLINYLGWNLFGNLAAVAKGQGVNILLNIFFGPVVNAARGIAMQVQSAVQSFVTNFQMAVNPQIIKSYAAEEKEYMTSLVIRSSKFSFLLMFLIAMPIILEINQILKLWLKIVPEYAAIFTTLVLIVILITSISGPLKTAVQATGRIRAYQATVGTLLLLILPISYFFLKLGYSPEVTLYINIVIEIIALIFRFFFLKRMVNFPVLYFIKEVLIRGLIIVFLSAPVLILIRNLMEASIFRLILLFVISFIWNILIAYLVGLNRLEKNYVSNNVMQLAKRFNFIKVHNLS